MGGTDLEESGCLQNVHRAAGELDLRCFFPFFLYVLFLDWVSAVVWYLLRFITARQYLWLLEGRSSCASHFFWGNNVDPAGYHRQRRSEHVKVANSTKEIHPGEDKNMRTKHPQEAEHDDTPLHKHWEGNLLGGTVTAHFPSKLIYWICRGICRGQPCAGQ